MRRRLVADVFFSFAHVVGMLANFPQQGKENINRQKGSRWLRGEEIDGLMIL